MDCIYWYTPCVRYYGTNQGGHLNRDVTFDNLLPTTGYVNYIETIHYKSRIQCAGLLYNQNTGTCHLLKTRLYEISFDRNRIDIGWGLFINNNGMYKIYKNAILVFKKSYLNTKMHYYQWCDKSFKIAYTFVLDLLVHTLWIKYLNNLLFKTFTVCGLGWHLYNAHCYIYIEMSVTWVQGKVVISICNLNIYLNNIYFFNYDFFLLQNKFFVFFFKYLSLNNIVVFFKRSNRQLDHGGFFFYTN